MENKELDLQMGINYPLLNAIRKDKGLTFADMEQNTKVPEGTIKNILLGKTRNPRGEALSKICKELGIPVEKAYMTDDAEEVQTQMEIQGIKEGNVSVLALKEMYELQIAAMKETTETHIHNIRQHYEQHHEDLKENYEKRLSDKRELIGTLKNANTFKNIVIGVLVGIFILLFIMELMHPEHGWLRY